MSIQQEKLKAIADKIRKKTGETDLIKPNDFVNKIDDVYEAGMSDIVDNINGMYRFFTNGQNMELLPYVIKHDWKGRTINMQYAFQDNKLIEEFTPPKNIKVTTSHGMLSGCSNLKTVSGLDKMIIGPVLTGLFYGCTSLRNAGTLNFENVQYANETFVNCSKLEEVRITGTITCEYTTGGLYLGACTLLSRESIESIINHLSDTIGMTLTLSTTAVINAFGSTTATEWIELITPKSNQYNGLWTISLV